MSPQLLRKSSARKLSTATSKSPIPVICLFGPTAVGKTDLLLELFKDTGEIISADSMQVYRCMDIGTAKPDSNYLKQLPHHLIDILEYTSQFNTGDFVKIADKAVRDIHRRKLLPVLSGGTAFYFRNFLYGLPAIPAVSQDLRSKLNKRKEQEGLEGLREELRRVDPASEQRIEKGDSSRIIRALEVFLGTGKPLSAFPLPSEPRDIHRCLMIGLHRERDELYSRINERVDIMFQRGLREEIISLIEQGASFDDPGMKGIGYSEFARMFENGCCSIEMVSDQIKQDSRRYAKRQMTFFKSLPGVEWYHPDRKEKIRERIEIFLEQSL